ncbi:ras-like protein rasD [Rhopilema esculentum]|uniref:ras-like protein rasD n=1 Tax=Rhopilema esculentum TaxID=499914 RepID=UPI0031DB9456
MSSLGKSKSLPAHHGGTVNKKPKVHKIVVMGEGGVGKSAITLQFVSNIFLDVRDPTIEDAYQSQIVVDDEACMLDILDTAGQEEFAAMREQYMRHGEGFIFVYSVTDFSSFQMLSKHLKTLERVRNFEPVPLVLVGNKSDLDERRQVSFNEGAALATEMDCLFLEASARTRRNVDETFCGMVREIRRRKRNGSELGKLEHKKGLLKRVRKYLKNLVK